MAGRLGARAALVILGAAIGLAGIVVLDGTRSGVGEGHDTSHYLSAATNLRDGKGVTVAFSSGFDPVDTTTALADYGRAPLTNYPPGYPMAIAATDIVTPGGVEAAARLLGVATVALIAVSAFVLAGALGASPLVKAGSACVAAFTPAALHLSMWAMSDAFAAALTLAAVAAAADSTHRHGRRRAWTELLAGVLAAATALTRYNGIVATVAVLLLVLLTRNGWRERCRAALRTAAPTVVVIVVNAAVDARRGTSPRPIAWHPSVSEDLAGLLDVIGMWTVGARSQAAERWAALLLIVGLAALTGLVVRGAGGSVRSLTRHRAIVLAVAAFVALQLVVVVVTSSLLDADVTPDRRVLVPLELLVVVLVVVGLARLLPEWIALPMVGLLVVLRLLVPTGALPEGIARPDMDHPRPQLYQLVADLPPDTILVANVPESLWRDTRRASIAAPAREDKLTGRAIPDLPGRLREMGRLVGAVDGLLVLEQPSVFGVPVDSPRDLNPAEVAQYLPCAQTYLTAAEGSIYDLSACAGE